MPVTKICPTCQGTFLSEPIHDRVYCSQKCYWNKGREKATCAECGIEFEHAKHTKKNSKRAFCSRECFLRNNGTGGTHVSFTCTQCGNRYERALGRMSWHSKNRFCSIACHHEWQKSNNPKGSEHPEYNSLQVDCKVCSKRIERQPHRIRIYEKQFCSKKSAGIWRSQNHISVNHPRWKGGDMIGYRGPNWRKQSASARKRDGYHCQHCRISEKKVGRLLDVHHIEPFRNFSYIPGENENYLQANELSNLITLCTSCHMRAEWGKIPLQPNLLST